MKKLKKKFEKELEKITKYPEMIFFRDQNLKIEIIDCDISDNLKLLDVLNSKLILETELKAIEEKKRK